MITAGVILLIINFLAKIAILWTIGIVQVMAGLVLALLGGTGRAVGGRAHCYSHCVHPGCGTWRRK